MDIDYDREHENDLEWESRRDHESWEINGCDVSASDEQDLLEMGYRCIHDLDVEDL